MKLFKIIALIGIAAFLSSCKTTSVSSSWKSPEYNNKPFHNIMVWAILGETDSTLRQQLETHLVNDLVSKGYYAISSLQVYKQKAYAKLTAKEIVDQYNSTAVDAVMTLVLLNKEKEETYYPGGYFNQTEGRYGNLDNYYSNAIERVLTPGYYAKTTNYYMEGNLFDTKNEKLVYSVQTKSFDPYTTDMLAHENGLLIVRDMIKKKIIEDKTLPVQD